MKEFFRDVLDKNPKNKENYIKYFFSDIAGVQEEPFFSELEGEPGFFISIVKDSVSRVMKPNGSGTTMERAWRNCIFFFIDSKEFLSAFGNEKKPAKYTGSKGNIQFDGSTLPDGEVRKDWVTIRDIERAAYDRFKRNHSSWFVRSYVYFIFVIADYGTPISKADFNVYYWNTNYELKPAPKKTDLFNNTKDVIFAKDTLGEIELIENSNRDLIDCVNAYRGKLGYHGDTEENFQDIVKDINNGIEYILAEGAARSGKTIIAMRLLREYSESKLLVMNFYFFEALENSFKSLGVPFPSDRIFHHNFSISHGSWIVDKRTKKIGPSLSFLIVDEAQRLGVLDTRYDDFGNVYEGINEIDKIVNCPNHKCTVFFGDDLQRLNKNTDRGMEMVHKAIEEKRFRQYAFKYSVGIPPEILSNIRYLLNIDSGNPLPTNNFKIECLDTQEDFLNRYFGDENRKKHAVVPGLRSLDNFAVSSKDGRLCLRKFPKQLLNTSLPFFLNKEIQDSFFLTPYQVISREIEDLFIFIPKTIKYDKKNDKIVADDANESRVITQHLYTLMTRATLHLVIFCENADLSNYIKEKITNIPEKEIEYPENENPTRQIAHSIPYDLFIAYHGTEDPNGSYQKAKEICDYAKSLGLSVFLNNYSCLASDADLGFNETDRAIQLSKNFLLVFNDNAPVDEYGLLRRKNCDGKPNQLNHEVLIFKSLVEDDERTNKKNFKFAYFGTRFDKTNIYNYLNRFYRPGTIGNSGCCLFSKEDVGKWLRP